MFSFSRVKIFLWIVKFPVPCFWLIIRPSNESDYCLLLGNLSQRRWIYWLWKRKNNATVFIISPVQGNFDARNSIALKNISGRNFSKCVFGLEMNVRWFFTWGNLAMLQHSPKKCVNFVLGEKLMKSAQKNCKNFTTNHLPGRATQ